VTEQAEKLAGGVHVAIEERGGVEAARVQRRLERIEELDRKRAPAGQLLGELRALVHEAEAWARVHSDEGEADVAEKVGEEVEGMQ
jgi:hypothetical protein